MIYLAYDGSINGDWIARYAVNMAANDDAKRLNLVHVETGEADRAELDGRIAAIAGECELAGVTLEAEVLPAGRGVFRTLIEHVPHGGDTFLVSGARLKAGAKGYLSGTLSERLLADRSFSVLVMRVVQPGLLGAPHDFLLPVAGAPEGFRVGADVLRLFAADVRRVELLRVMQVKTRAFRHMHPNRVARMRETGRAYLADIEARLIQQTGLDRARIDLSVAVSDDWAREIVIAASRHRSHLICMEAHRESLGHGFLYGNPMEIVLRDAPCDVAVYRGIG